MAKLFPRTEVAGVSMPRILIGTNWLLGYSHRSPAQDRKIKAQYDEPAKFLPVFEAYAEYGIDAVMGPVSTTPIMYDAIKYAEEKLEKKLIIIDTPGMNVDDSAEARREAEKVIKHSAEIGSTFCLVHHASCEQLINKNLGEGWELTDINILMSGPDRDTSDMEYTLTYTERLSAGESTPPAFTEIVFSPKFDKTSIETMVGKSFNVDVIAEAIQAATFNSAVEAFANYDGVAPDAPNTDWYDENATEYTLDSAEDLLGFAQKVNSGVNFKGKTVKLGADINLQNIEWTPIGYKANNNGGFGGTFDGQGHTISNLYVDVNDGAGLFGYVFATGTRPVVKNVKVENATITGTHYAGVIAAHTNGHITGCSVVNATISCADPAGKDGDKVGSIVGFAGSDVSFEISGNYAKNVTISANRDAGAIVGRIDAAKHTLSGNTFENVTVTHNGYETGANISNNEAGRIDNQ